MELAEVAADGASPEDIALAQEIIAYAKREGLGPQWLANPSAVFAIGPDVQYFKVYATGHIRFPFSRLPPNPKMPELFARLNDTVPALGLEQGDERTGALRPRACR